MDTPEEPSWSFASAVPPGQTPAPPSRSVSGPGPRVGALLGGHYLLLEPLGRGGMGTVFRARDERSGRELALKVLNPRQLTQRGLARFQREGKALAALRHPHVVRVHDMGQTQGWAWMALELVPEGRPLDRVLGELDRERLLQQLCGVARGLGQAHRQGIVHRDVKPSNLLVDREGHVLLTDFGLAMGDSYERLTGSGEMVGTPTYMAPEQISSQRDQLGPATDVWGLGAVLYQVLTGQPPFLGDSLQQLLLHITEGRYRPPRSCDPSISPALAKLIERSLSPEPARRYPNGAAFAAALEQARYSPPAPAPTRWRTALVVAALLALGVGGGLALGLRPPPPAAPTQTQQPQDEAAALLAEAQRLDQAGQGERAEQVLDRLLAQAPDCAEGWALRATLRSKRGEQESALADARRGVALDASSGEVWASLALVHHLRGELDEAEAASRRGVELEPDRADLWSLRGEVLRKLKRLKEAEQACLRALELDADSPFALNNLGLTLLDQGRTEEAEGYLRQTTRVNPAAVPPWNNLAQLVLQRGDPEGALTVYDQGVARCEDPVALLRNRARLRAMQGDRSGALADLERWLERTPEDFDARLQRAQLLVAGGDAEGTRAELAAIEARSPQDPTVWDRTALGYHELKDYAAAREALLRAVELGGESAERLAQLGLEQELGGDEEQALRSYGRSLELGDTASARYYRGDLYRKRGALALARDDLRRCLELLPADDAHREQLQATLNELETSLGQGE